MIFMLIQENENIISIIRNSLKKSLNKLQYGSCALKNGRWSLNIVLAEVINSLMILFRFPFETIVVAIYNHKQSIKDGTNGHSNKKDISGNAHIPNKIEC
jgi:hypothetical protein